MADKTATSPASRCAVPSSNPSTEQELIALQAQAENNMASALQMLRQQDCTPGTIEKALIRATRAATALRRMCTAVQNRSEVAA